jgi:hypothetical protein
MSIKVNVTYIMFQDFVLETTSTFDGMHTSCVCVCVCRDVKNISLLHYNRMSELN